MNRRDFLKTLGALIGELAVLKLPGLPLKKKIVGQGTRKSLQSVASTDVLTWRTPNVFSLVVSSDSHAIEIGQLLGFASDGCVAPIEPGVDSFIGYALHNAQPSEAVRIASR